MAVSIDYKKLITSELDKWREERGLKVEDQRANFEANFKEEVSEYLQALQNEDKHEMVDALADMCIIAINAGFEFKYGTPEDSILYKDILSISAMDNMNNFLNGNSFAGFTWINCTLIALGYDIDSCILEAIKEISSRTGAWDDSVGKWVKDTSPEAQEKWHKADYSKCAFRGGIFWSIWDDYGREG